ncbi:hypothetical protein E9993_22885, partial [Labilibacter sediminis]
MSHSDKKDNECSCCQTCSDTIKRYKELLEEMTRRAEDLSYERYEQSKIIKPLKAKLEATTKDFKRMAEENSMNKSWLIFAKEDNAKLTAELEALKAKYQNNEFSIRKFDASQIAVENLIDEQTKYRNQEKEKKGIGYNEVPPPWNDNYTSPLYTKESDTPMQYGKQPTDNKTENVSASKSDDNDVHDANASSSCAGNSLDEGHKQESLNLNASDSACLNNISDSVCLDKDSVSGFATVGESVLNAVFDYGCVETVEPNVCDEPASKSVCAKCACMNECVDPKSNNPTNEKRAEQIFGRKIVKGFDYRDNLNKHVTYASSNVEDPSLRHRRNSNYGSSTSNRPGQIPDNSKIKKQTCFNCGIADHIAKNCPKQQTFKPPTSSVKP